MSAPGAKADVPPSAHEMTIGQGFPSPNQPDKRRIATYRAGLGPALCGDALCATVVSNRGSHPGRCHSCQVNEMANWWEDQFELIRTDWLAFLMQGEPVAIVLLLVVILFGYLTWIGIRFVWEYFRNR